MAKKTPTTSRERKGLIESLINAGEVHSQSQLLALLKKRGIAVTQATISRDLEDLGAIRSKDDSGIMKYALRSTLRGGSDGGTATISGRLILSITSSGNLVVLRTPPGGAQLLASELDAAAGSGVLASAIGTIAGDDTVLVVAKSANGGTGLASELRKFARG
jgi:transcriptional regulator of arginine metabolism